MSSHSSPSSNGIPSIRPGQARIQSFRVVPYLPESLKPLMEIGTNLWWTWNAEAISLFSRLDRELWEATKHNPVKLLGAISQEKLDRAAMDKTFIHQLNTVQVNLREHMASSGWYGQVAPTIRGGAGDKPCRIAYFCAEFGLTECFQIYSGGLGGLAGDHLKSAAELGLPLVAVGLLYRKGYFHQYLNPDGYQQEFYPELDPANQPIRQVIDEKTGHQLRVHVELPGRTLAVGVWRCDVGRVPLYLLDTNLPENTREDRDITANLYGGDMEMRIRQEVVLGVGGVRALSAVGEEPTVVHMNEGHAAFANLERIIRLRAATGFTFDEVREAVASASVFTTHTPVPAGIDRFPPRLVEQFFSHALPGLGLDLEGLLALGRENTADRNEFFSMAVLAIRTSRFANGVSRLHGEVSRGMWKGMWPGVPEQEVPIGHVTNGVHARTWVSSDFVRLYDRYLGDRWHTDPQDPGTWKAIDEISDDELWRTHNRRREKLVGWCRRKVRDQLVARGAGALEIERAASALDTRALTIGFARRFATYKRGTLLFRDPPRLLSILKDEQRPVQLIIAGKSHPRDEGGKRLIRDIVDFVRKNNVQHRVVFIEDYDLHVARRLVQGCDVWLNTPIRGLEASGTSGMKAAMNGCLHCSILDGWWDEGFDPEAGFAIGRGESYDEHNRDEMDDIESRSLYHLIQTQIVPEFYDREGGSEAQATDGVGAPPRRWLARMRRCIKQMAPAFNTHRMVRDYATGYYFPGHVMGSRLSKNNLEEGRGLAHVLDHYRHHWHKIAVESVESQSTSAAVSVRSLVRVTATVRLAEIAPEQVQVQLYHGRLGALGELLDGSALTMQHAKDLGDGRHLFTGAFAPSHSGQHGFSVRVIPSDTRLVHPFVPGLITWDRDPQPAAEEAVVK